MIRSINDIINRYKFRKAARKQYKNYFTSYDSNHRNQGYF